MSPLARAQREFLAAVLDGEAPEDAGLATYRRNILGARRDAIASAHPVTLRLVGTAFFDEAAERHARATPSASGDLHGYGAGFADFLAAYQHARGLPYLPDVARLEWAVHESSHAADGAPFDYAALARVPAALLGELRARLHPAARLVASAHPILALWEANQPERDGEPDRRDGADRVLVRREGQTVKPIAVDAVQWTLLSAFASGASLGDACSALEDPERELAPALARIASLGALEGFELGARVRIAPLLAGLAFAAFSHAAPAQDASMRLEMLAERIAKLHAQMGQGILVERSRKALASAIGEFDAGLKEVGARASGPEIRDNYILLGLLWTEYRAWALKPPTRDNAKKLAERAEEVTWVAGKGARLVQEGRKGTGLLALEAAHAATLSQRLARLYLAHAWGVKQESASRDIPTVTQELQGSLSRLRAAPQNTPQIETELHAAVGQLGFLLQNGRELGSRKPSPTAPEFIAKSADHFLESMEHVVRLYEGGQ